MTSQWQLQPIFGSYVLTSALAVLLFALLLIRPTFGHLSAPRQRRLTLVRGLIALLLLLAMLRPAYIRTEKLSQVAQVLVLFDTSRSMDHRDGEEGKTRWERQLELIRKSIPKLSEMGDSFQVELIGFSNGIEPQERSGDRLTIRSKPTGEETDIRRTLQDTAQRYVGQRIAAVVLISDGAQRALTPKMAPQQAARQLDRLGTPLYTIVMGQSRDQAQSRDVAIENLQDEYSVFVKNEFALRVGVRIQGYVGLPVAVSVTVEDAEGQTTTLGPKELVATQNSQIVMGDFSFRPEQAGEYKLRVTAASQPGEMIDNNSMTAFLTVREGGLRVLLLSSGLHRQEQKFIRRSLDQSPDMELDFHLENVKRRATWPVDLESKEVRLEDYDVFVIGDIDARAFRPENWSTIAELVGSGGGLMMYGGYHSFGPGGYAENALANVLPVEMGRFEREPDPTKVTRKDRHLEGELIMLPTVSSSITHLASDDQKNEATWRELKPLLGANRFHKLKDRSEVLAESPNSDPLLVKGVYLGGRVLALATDSTYRWYRFGQSEAHKRFWRQSILWLARRDKQEANSIFIELPQRRYQARSRIEFQTGLTDEAGDVIVDAKLRTMLLLPDGSTESIPLSAGIGDTASTLQNAMQGIVANTEIAGDYRLTVDALDGDNVITTSSKEFVIEKKDFELSDPAANPGLLEMLSKLTSRAGGKTIASEQLSNLLDEIKSSPPKSEIETQSKWQLGDKLIDAWIYFGLLVLLLSAEWFLRKKWGLV